MKKKFLLKIMPFLFCYHAQLTPEIHHAVTYELSPGRFGDNLLSYIHAKWVSYRFHLPLLYKPFIYSDELILHKSEYLYSDSCKNVFKKIVTLNGKLAVNLSDSSPTLYVVPYFPESKYELRDCKNFSGTHWDYFLVNWNDREFIDVLKKFIIPCNSVVKISLPTNRVNIALHIRAGGSYDTQETIAAFPLKFVSTDFFINQIKKLYLFLNNTPLYVCLFTDDNNPMKIVGKLKENLKKFDIQFDCRKQKGSDAQNVINDFFTLQQFDCLLHSESNFSFIMSKIGDFMISIYPDSFYKEGHQLIYNHVNFTVNYQHKKFRQFGIK